MDARTTERGPSAEKPGLPVQRPEQLPPPKDRKTAAPPKADDKTPSFRERLREHWLLATVAACVLVVAAVGGLLYWLSVRDYESTDDAFVAARSFSIAPKVGGYITDVPVTDNQHVNAGDLLAKDRRPRLQDRGRSGQGAGRGRRSQHHQHQRADRQPAGTDQAGPGAGRTGRGATGVRATGGSPRQGSGRKGRRHRAERAAAHTPTCNRSRPTPTAPRPR